MVCHDAQTFFDYEIERKILARCKKTPQKICQEYFSISKLWPLSSPLLGYMGRFRKQNK